MNKNNRNAVKNLFPYLILMVVIFVVITVLNFGRVIVKDISTGELISALNNKEVTEITITPSADESVYYIEGRLKNYKEQEKFKTKVIEAEVGEIIKYAENNELKVYETNADPGKISWLYIIVNVLPLFIILGSCYFLFSKMANSNKGSMDFGKSRAKLSPDGGKYKFKDVAGLKEEKEEVHELIDFLKNPKKFQN